MLHLRGRSIQNEYCMPFLSIGIKQSQIWHFSILAAAVFLLMEYIIFNGYEINFDFVIFLIVFDVILLLFISFIFYKRIRIILNLKDTNTKRHSFRRQIFILFSSMAIIPSICLFIFWMLFFNVNIENLFKTPMNVILNNAKGISALYTNEMENTLAKFVDVISIRIKGCINEYAVDTSRMNKVLNEEFADSRVDVSVIQKLVFGSSRIISKTTFAAGAEAEFEEKLRTIDCIENGNTIIQTTPVSVTALSMIDENLGIYLLASAPINEYFILRAQGIKNAIDDYSNIKFYNAKMRYSFIALFFTLVLLIVLISILIGAIFARRIFHPIRKLIIATEKMSNENYINPVSVPKTKTEIDILVSTFNNMVTQLEQQKQRLVELSKQNAWKDIARKIAHEIKNPLTPIQLSVERLRNKYQNEITSDPEVFRSCIDTVLRQVHCINGLIKEFSDFARMPAPKLDRVDIVKLLEQVIFIQATANRNIKFEHNFDRKEFFCSIDPGQINQVMMNLIQNAINSIVENNTSKYPYIGNIVTDFFVRDGTMNISIEDDGVGFSGDGIKKAFEPYYTTREKGTGLGLAIVHRIIKDHNGEIRLGKSVKLGGAKVSITMPCTRFDL